VTTARPEMMMQSIPAAKAAVVFRLLFLCIFVAAAWEMSYSQDDNSSANKNFSPEAAAIFTKRCTACHTYGKGIKVGPDLKGVTIRRKRDWLIKFVRGSSLVIKSGDPTATTLFEQFKHQRMPDWSDLSEKQVNDIMDYLSIDGPNIKPADEQNAEIATATDTAAGQKLFYGQVAFKYGSQACSTCHSVRQTGIQGGTLGPNLTNTYFKYQDEELTLFLRHPCFDWDGSTTATYLTPKESFDVKAFLYQSALTNSARGTYIPGSSLPSTSRDADRKASPISDMGRTPASTTRAKRVNN
jgi:mono/diheme cytochrome c family protein